MVKDNGWCGVGVAYECNIGCLKRSYTKSSDMTEAEALGHKNGYIDIYSNSWGPKVKHGFEAVSYTHLTLPTIYSV